MKSYIILTSTIGNMGGAQMFTSNKVAYLKRNGWSVQVFHYIKVNEIKLPELVPFKDNYLKDFRSAFYYVPKWYMRKIAGVISEKIGAAEEIVIESHLVELAYWGEALAKLLGARHIINYLEERIEPLSETKALFFEYKLHRWELMNSDERSQKLLFKGFYKQEYSVYANQVNFVCSNVVSSEPLSVEFAKSDFTILTIGRLNKPYVMPMTESICDFAYKFPNKSINVIYVGGSPDGILERSIPAKYEHLDNVHVYMLGYTFPVPEALLDKTDVGIASANSILVTANHNIPTICLDINDNCAFGVYGYTTYSKFLRQTRPKEDVSQLLEDILINQKYPKKDRLSIEDESEIELKKQVDYLEKSKNFNGYYDVYSMYKKRTILLANFKWYFRRIIETVNPFKN